MSGPAVPDGRSSGPGAPGDGPERRRGPLYGGRVPDAFTPGSAPEDDLLGQATVRLALRSGVSVLDSGDVTTAAPAEELVARALSDGGRSPEIHTTLCGEPGELPEPFRPGGRPPGPATPGPLGQDPTRWASDLDAALERAYRRLRPHAPTLVWLPASALSGLGEPKVRSALNGWVASGRVGAWGVRFEQTPPEPETLLALIGRDARAFAFPFHLLNADVALPAVRTAARAGARIVALDAHAGGRLNGLRFAGPLARPVAGGSPVTDFELLRAELEPITRLGFLTQNRQRTLAQAALQFVLQTGGVEAAILPLSDPRRIEEWTRALERPALSPEEQTRVEHLTAELRR